MKRPADPNLALIGPDGQPDEAAILAAVAECGFREITEKVIEPAGATTG